MRSAAGYLNDGSFAKAVPHAVRVRNSFSSTAARMLAFTGNQLYTIPAIYRFRADSGSHLLRFPNGCSGRAAAAFRRCRVRMVSSVCRTLHAGMLPADGEVLQLRSALQAYAAAAEREAAQAARYGALVFEACTDAYVPDADLIENQAMIPDMSRVLLRLAVKKLVPFQDRVISEQTLRQLLRIPAWNPCLKRSARIWTTRRIACGSWRRFCLTERFRPQEQVSAFDDAVNLLRQSYGRRAAPDAGERACRRTAECRRRQSVLCKDSAVCLRGADVCALYGGSISGPENAAAHEAL